jgi:hypothetical protein
VSNADAVGVACIPPIKVSPPSARVSYNELNGSLITAQPNALL